MLFLDSTDQPQPPPFPPFVSVLFQGDLLPDPSLFLSFSFFFLFSSLFSSFPLSLTLHPLSSFLAQAGLKCKDIPAKDSL